MKTIIIGLIIISLLLTTGCINFIPTNGCWLDRDNVFPVIKCVEERNEQYSYSIYAFHFANSDEFGWHELYIDRCNIVPSANEDYTDDYLNYEFMRTAY